MASNRELVTVTGAAGFVGSHLVAELLTAGYRVRGTVRRRDRAEELQHLTALPGATERLELVEADLLVPGSFDAAVSGVDGVFHTASPFFLAVKDPQRDLVDPALAGTLNVLRSCAAAPGIRRVVLTSSIAAVTDEPRSDYVFSEKDWNTTSSLKRNPYYYSKTVAERAAWDFMRDAAPSFDLVAINPFVVLGPQLGPRLSTSNQILADLLAGVYPGILDLDIGIVDVRDVARAHRLALETPGANGRYLCAGDVLPLRRVVEEVRAAAPDPGRLPTRSMESALGTAFVKAAATFQPAGLRSYMRTHLGKRFRYDTTKIQQELGMSFRPAAEVVRETVHYLRPGAGPAS